MRHGLRPDDRYIETRGGREPQQQGRCRSEAGRAAYLDHAGFALAGDCRDGLLYRAGTVLYRPAR